MTYVTEILADESGIQYGGVKDKTGGTGTYPITGLITGQFRRGRYDKPMTITNANIRAMLGYDPKNPSYIAVQDALSQGVPSVQVLRLKKEVELICSNLFSSNTIFRIYPASVNLTQSQLDEFANAVENSIKIYVGKNGVNIPVPVELQNYSLRFSGEDYFDLTFNEEAIGSYFSVVVCATVATRITTDN